MEVANLFYNWYLQAMMVSKEKKRNIIQHQGIIKLKILQRDETNQTVWFQWFHGEGLISPSRTCRLQIVRTSDKKFRSIVFYCDTTKNYLVSLYIGTCWYWLRLMPSRNRETLLCPDFHLCSNRNALRVTSLLNNCLVLLWKVSKIQVLDD